MKYLNKIFLFLLATIIACCIISCEKESVLDTPEVPNAPYILSLGVMSKGTTTYYVVSTEDLMSGIINAVGKGIEQNGYHDYEQGNQTVFCIGGLGVTNATGITRNSAGYLQETGDFVFESSLSAFTQIDDHSMMGMEIPANAATGNDATFYTVDINTIAITSKKTTSILPLATLDWPSISGLVYNEGKVFVTYLPMNSNTYATNYTDTTYVAVFSYPEMTLDKIIKDTRTGTAGSWNAFNGIFKTESGDVYIMSNSSLTNGYSQSTKHAAFLRIPKGQTQFDNYYFDFESKSGGLKPAHMKYLGNGLIFAEVCTLNPQTPADRWTDKSLKCCIIDLNNQTIKDIPEIPIHNGGGGRRFVSLVENGYVYCPVATASGVYIYRVDPQTATAVKGAKVSTTFVGGLFKMK